MKVQHNNRMHKFWKILKINVTTWHTVFTSAFGFLQFFWNRKYLFGPILRSRDWWLINACYDFCLCNDECLTIFPSPRISSKYALKILQILREKDIWQFDCKVFKNSITTASTCPRIYSREIMILFYLIIQSKHAHICWKFQGLFKLFILFQNIFTFLTYFMQVA